MWSEEKRQWPSEYSSRPEALALALALAVRPPALSPLMCQFPRAVALAFLVLVAVFCDGSSHGMGGPVHVCYQVLQNASTASFLFERKAFAAADGFADGGRHTGESAPP